MHHFFVADNPTLSDDEDEILGNSFCDQEDNVSDKEYTRNFVDKKEIEKVLEKILIKRRMKHLKIVLLSTILARSSAKVGTSINCYLLLSQV